MSSQTQAAPDGPRLLDMYRMMALIREFEEQVRSSYLGGMVPGMTHLCAGQEATTVGVCAALERDGHIASHHRGHGHCLAKGRLSGGTQGEHGGHA